AEALCLRDGGVRSSHGSFVRDALSNESVGGFLRNPRNRSDVTHDDARGLHGRTVHGEYNGGSGERPIESLALADFVVAGLCRALGWDHDLGDDLIGSKIVL